ncbi:hypothetical protein ABK040_009532 [Willaertia magna]
MKKVVHSFSKISLKNKKLLNNSFRNYSSLENVFYKNSTKPIDNKETILNDIDNVLGKHKPPAFEYLYIEPAAFRNPFFEPSSHNPYGHAAIRYTNPENGESIVMNIVGRSDKRMVNFLKAEDYIFGDPDCCNVEGNEQGGIYLRTIIGFRFEEWPLLWIENMHNYFKEIQQQELDKDAKYEMLLGPVYNFLRKYNILNVSERGNCSYWTTKGMVKARIFKKPTMWPKFTNVKLYTKVVFNEKRDKLHIPDRITNEFYDEEEIPYFNRDNFNIVTYRCANEDIVKTQLKGWVRPFNWLEHAIFQQMDDMANVVVGVKTREDGSTIAIPNLKEFKHRPFW